MFDVCDVCGRRHDTAHRCPIVRLNPALWLDVLGAVSARPVPVHELPAFDVECPHCCARFWRDENINCCSGGRLQLPLDQEVPDTLAEVILSAHVRANIRRYPSVARVVLCVNAQCCDLLRHDYRQVQHGFLYGICGS